MNNLPQSVVHISFMSRDELELALKDAMDLVANLSGWQAHPLATLRRLEQDSNTLIRLTEEIGERSDTEPEDTTWEQIGRAAIDSLREDFKNINRMH